MSVAKITTVVAHGVTLGAGAYGSALFVTGTGAILPPAASGQAGISGAAGLSTVELRNDGTIAGSYGGPNGFYGGNGAAGIDLGVTVSIDNAGLIQGGSGGNGPGFYSPGGNGAVGLQAGGGTLDNAGFITGGNGGASYYGGGAGAASVVFSGFASLTNDGGIYGGNAGYTDALNGNEGGVGVSLASGGTLINQGIIRGGSGANSFGYPAGGLGGAGGAGVILGATASVLNTGTIQGGDSGASRIDPRPGGIALAFTAGTFSNDGFVLGGYTGSAVVFSQVGTVTNTGTILGGDNGVGVSLSAGGALSNSGTIDGGTGIGFKNYSAGVAGGAGVAFAGPGTLVNTGIIEGGVGGRGKDVRYHAGAGGAGVSLSGGGVLVNDGDVGGGMGGQAPIHAEGAGGVGVFIDGGTLVDQTGTIAGGLVGKFAPLAFADSVQFGGGGTLEVYGGAVFLGTIAADPHGDDTLLLASGAPGNLDNFKFFETITEQSDANWSLTADIQGPGTLTIGQGAILSLSGTISIQSVAFASGGGEKLTLQTPATVTSTIDGFAAGDTIDLVGILANALTYQSGTLTLLGAGGQAVDQLHLAGSYTASDFALHSVPAGTALTVAAPAVPVVPEWHAMARGLT
jgi:hypothetical protein